MPELVAFVQDNRDRDARAIGDLYRRARASIVDSTQYLMEAGQRLTEKKASLERGEWLPWLADNADVLGFKTRRTAALLMQAAVKWGASFPLDEAEAVQINRQIWGHTTRGTTGTGDNEWFTPSEYIEAAREVLGRIDLDPASNVIAQEKTVKAARYFTREDDGLAQEWLGRVWLNPPYATDKIGPFVDKLVQEVFCGRVTAAIMLTHNYTDTAWFHTAARSASALCFPLGRVRFVNSEGDTANPTQGQCFSYFGSDVAEFVERFSQFGLILLPGVK
jgi:phage N-6-adenine-methyltransferase